MGMASGSAVGGLLFQGFTPAAGSPLAEDQRISVAFYNPGSESALENVAGRLVASCATRRSVDNSMDKSIYRPSLRK